MAGEIQGTTQRALGQRPGEKVVFTYTGKLAHGESIYTYLSGFDTYHVSPLADSGGAGNNPYVANVYATNLSSNGQVYFSVYNVGDGGQVAAANAVKCTTLIVGSR